MGRTAFDPALLRHLLCVLLGALALVSWPACPATAQQSRDWGAFVDSLASRSDTSALRALAPAHPDRAGADALLAGGFAALRAHELSRDEHDIESARRLFGRATSRFPGLAWARYGHALALAGGPEVRLPSPGGVLDALVTPQSVAQVLHLDPASQARRELRRALRLDPGLDRAAIELVHQATAAHDEDGLRAARAALTGLREAGRARPEAVLALADAERALGNVRAAAAVAASPEAGSGPAADYVRAAALLREQGRQRAGAEAYFAGVARVDSATAVRYFDDLRYIATPAELARWRGADLATRRQFLQDFWTMRAALAGIEVADRMADHYRRLALVEKEYRRDAQHGSPPPGAHLLLPYDSLTPFDDRGVIYLRHGPPDHVVQTSSSELRPNVSWIYAGPNGRPRSFHFVEFEHAPGFRLVDNVLAVVDPTIEDLSPEPLIEYLDQRVVFDPELAPLLARLRGVPAALRRFGSATADPTAPGAATVAEALQSAQTTSATIAAAARERTREALRTDSDQPDFAARLPFYFDLYTFRGPADRTDVVAALAVPGDRLTRADAADRNVYLLRLSFIVVDTATRMVTRVDSTYALRTDHALRAGEYIRLATQLSAPAADGALERLVLRNAADSAGEAYSASEPVPRYAAGKLALSDLVLAEPADSGTWHRGSVSLALVPPREFPEGAFSAFYEIYGLPAGTPYETTLEVEGMDRSAISTLLGLGGNSMRLTFRGDARPDSAGIVQSVQHIRSKLKQGRYRITVTVKNLTTGESTRRSRELLVHARRR